MRAPCLARLILNLIFNGLTRILDLTAVVIKEKHFVYDRMKGEIKKKNFFRAGCNNRRLFLLILFNEVNVNLTRL